MAPEGRDRITGLYHAALELAPGDRAAFLRSECDGDDGLRLEVESLLRHATASAAFLETPVDFALQAESATAMVGRAFGPYRINSLLGAGGMGEVYRARDTKLGRDVAVKILPQAFTADPERRARFAREARVLATLHHPHIAAIYGLEEVGDRSALVLELVEGPTLADRLERGPLPLADALSIARQLVEALDAAHLKGIIHRDLKPANIVLEGTTATAPGDSRVKVLDFGIAKTISGGEADQQGLTSFDGTGDGRILGTPAYMSPEQARGQAVDKRSDIWAFGCVLYEMLTGHRAFAGAGITDTLARILEREPGWALLPSDTPPSIRGLLQRCLEKDPQKRLRDVADARLVIDDGAPGTPERSVTSGRGRERLRWVSTALLVGAVLAAGSLALWQRRGATTAEDSLALEIGPPPGSRFVPPLAAFAIAPDGSHIAMVVFSGKGSALWIRRMNSPEYRQLRGTESAVSPFWSPDSRQIGFFANGKLKTVGLSGEAPFEVCDARSGYFESGGGAWNRDGVILFRPTGGPLQKVASTGGTPRPVTALKDAETSHSWPWFLPDGQHFLFVASGAGTRQLRVGSLTSTDSKPLGRIRSNAAYVADHILFLQGGLMAQRFELRALELTGEPQPLTEAMRDLNGLGSFSVSETGLLGYAHTTGGEVQLTWMSRTGTPVGTLGEKGAYFNLGLSPDDGKAAVASQAPDGNIDIWVLNAARGGDKIRVTSDRAGEYDPVWSPDGKHIAFTSNRPAAFGVFRRSSDGSGSDVPLFEAPLNVFAPDWSRNGRFIIFGHQQDLWIKPLEGAAKPAVFVPTPFTENSPAFSPDGRWVAYSSDRTGSSEIYVRPFAAKEPEYKISRDGGRFPRWRTDREIFFLSPDGTLISARFDAATSPPGVVLQSLFQTGLTSVAYYHPYDVAKDGQRFLIPVAIENPDSRSIVILTNWTARLPR